jgi:hypothetical protein
VRRFAKGKQVAARIAAWIDATRYNFFWRQKKE